MAGCACICWLIWLTVFGLLNWEFAEERFGDWKFNSLEGSLEAKLFGRLKDESADGS